MFDFRRATVFCLGYHLSKRIFRYAKDWWDHGPVGPWLRLRRAQPLDGFNHQRRTANCDWMPPSYTIEQSSGHERHPNFFAKDLIIVSYIPRFEGWTPAPLPTHHPPDEMPRHLLSG